MNHGQLVHTSNVSKELFLRMNMLFEFIIHNKQMIDFFHVDKMFRRKKRQIENITFVQPLKGEVYFYTPIAYSTKLENSGEKNEMQIFKDSDLALAGKLKLIFEREKMNWFEIREEKSTTSSKSEHFFALYFYPHRLVAGRNPPFDEKATMQNIEELFDFIVTKEQHRPAEVKLTKTPLAYSSVEEEPYDKYEAITLIAGEPPEESEELTFKSRRRKKQTEVSEI